MKKMNFLLRTILVAAFICTNMLSAKADFYAWEFKKYIDSSSGEDVTKYHNGASLGSSTFTEKDMTVEMWLYIPAEEFVNGRTITSSRHNGHSGFSVDIDNDKIRAYFENVAAPGGEITHADASRIFTMSLPKESFIDQWAHVAFVCSSTDNELRSYLNGELYETISGYEVEWLGNFKSDGANVGALRLGFWYSDAAKFIGKMGDFRLWNVARTTEEVKANYNQYLEGAQTGLYRNYHFTKNGRDHANLGSAGGTIWFDPDAGWGNVYKRHIYATFPGEVATPQNLIVADNVLSWNADGYESWEIGIFTKADNTEVYTETVATNSVSLKSISELLENVGYYAKVRALSAGFSSAWATSEVFGFVNSVVEEGDFYACDMSAARPGDQDGISCGNIEFTGKDITIELWLNIESANFTSEAMIASTRINGNKGFSLDVTKDATQLRGFFRNDNGDKLNGRTDYVFPFFFAKADVVDKWVHIAIVFSSTNNIARSYLNGEIYEDLVKSTEPYEPYNIGWIGNENFSMRLGYWYAATAKLYAQMADFRIWSVGRTDEQIKENYNKNLVGDNLSNYGLYLNYKFDNYERNFVNNANPTVATNSGWYNPATDWNTYYTQETLSAYPRNLAIAEGVMSWDATDGEFEVVVFNEEDTQVASTSVDVNSISLSTISGLSENTNYYAKVRTLNNGFYSGWVTSDNFTVTKTATGIDMLGNTFTVVSKANELIINSDSPRTMNLRAIDGRTVRVVNVSEGETVVSGLSAGIYLLDNQKVVIK